MEERKLIEVPYTMFEYPHYPDADFWCPLCGRTLDPDYPSRCKVCGVRIVGETVDAQEYNARLRAKYPELRGTVAKFEDWVYFP